RGEQGRIDRLCSTDRRGRQIRRNVCAKPVDNRPIIPERPPRVQTLERHKRRNPVGVTRPGIFNNPARLSPPPPPPRRKNSILVAGLWKILFTPTNPVLSFRSWIPCNTINPTVSPYPQRHITDPNTETLTTRTRCELTLLESWSWWVR